MLAEIITIGDEILIGQITDTNSVFISQELNKIGVPVYQITSIQDDREHILEALKEAENKVDLVLITGGLGPTKDDITKETFLEYFDDSLLENKEVLANIKRIFKEYVKREPLPANLSQAMIPSKAIMLPNQLGTAPGMWMEKNNTVFISMPGVPYEMKQLVQEEVLPRVIKKFDRPFIYHKTLLTYGKGESEIQEMIQKWEDKLPGYIRLAYLPSPGRVRLRLSSTGKDKDILYRAVDSQMDELYTILKEIAIGYENETSVQKQLASRLVAKNAMISFAESCTGGAIAREFTAISGASTYFKGSIIPYNTAIKTEVLGVDPAIIKKYNVVSTEVAEAMAIQSNKLFKTEYSLSTTGIAGPGKGEGDDEVGTVCIAIASPEGVISEKFSFGNARERVIKKAVNKAFEMLLKEI